MKICYQCFKQYDSEYTVCPYCGQAECQSVSEPQYLRPGTVLQSHYLIGIVIGAGGFGTTYAAWDKTLNQKVAIKEFLPGEFSTRMPGQTQVTVYGGEKAEQFTAGKKKFCDESKKLARFQEIPGIVHIYNSFEENGTAYIVMEYLEGETLAERLKREKKIPEQEAIQIMLPILQALDVVHKEGILHRDIAPNNIFLTRDGRVKLLDFGAARNVTGTHSKSLTVLYKEGYTPEEQYRSRGDQGSWTDVYACAATLYHMLTGKIPAGALERRRKDELKSPSNTGAKVGGQVDIAVMNALNVDIKDRTQSAKEFEQELIGVAVPKKHFVRTKENRTGRIPEWLRWGMVVVATGISVFAVLLFLGIIQINLVNFESLLLPEGKARVPNLISRDIDSAEQLAQKWGLEFKIIDKQFSNEIPEGKILSQSIGAGKIVDSQAVLEIVVSGGKKTKENGYVLMDGEVFVPDVQYKAMDESLEMLKNSELEVQFLFEENDQIEEGRVIQQEFVDGEAVEEGRVIQLVVSSYEAMSVAYESIQNNEYHKLDEVYDELSALTEKFGENKMAYVKNEKAKDKMDTLVMTYSDTLVLLVGETCEGLLNGKVKRVVRCHCGAEDPYRIYEGEWQDGMADGEGIIRDHFENGASYRIEGEFRNNYAQGEMRIEWIQGDELLHGIMICQEGMILENSGGLGREEYGIYDPFLYIFTYSEETDEKGLPLGIIAAYDGMRLSSWGIEL